MNNFHPDFLGEVARRVGMTPRSHYRQFVVQHLYEDTLRLLLTSHRFFPIDVVISIGYSGKKEVVEKLKEAGIRVLTPTFQELEETIRAELHSSLERCRQENAKLMIHEVGGYAITSFHKYYREYQDYICGSVEITKQGVWAAQRIENLLIPQLNCAETRLKEIEADFVGDAVVLSLDVILRELGYALAGRTALVTGYGWIGRGVCRGLSAKRMTVAAYDVDVIKKVALKLDGYLLLDELKSLDQVSVLVGASGVRSIGPDLIDRLADRTVLVSASSKNVEIDVDYLHTQAKSIEMVHPYVQAYHLPDKVLYLVNEGYPVNFIGSSVQDEIVEFLFAEALILMEQLVTQDFPPGTYPLEPKLEEIAAQVWLDLR
jgi:adenosylhomocysteinase